MIMELIHGGSLQKFIEDRIKENNPISDLEASIIMKSILDGVFYIHTKNIVHRDLKPGTLKTFFFLILYQKIF